MAIDVFAEMDQEIEAAAVRQAEAKARAEGGFVFFFKLKDGERALIRFLLDLRGCASVWKHEFFNVATNKYDVSAICARSCDLDVSLCKHCQDAASNRKLEAVKYFVAPVYVYGIKDKAGNAITYKDKDGNNHPDSGIRLMQMKATSPLAMSLRENYRMLEEGDTFLNHDMTISVVWQNGDRKKPIYTPVLRPAQTAFVAPDGVEIPEQSVDQVITTLMDTWKPAIIDNPNYDTFGANPPAQSQSAKAAPAKSSVPDF